MTEHDKRRFLQVFEDLAAALQYKRSKMTEAERKAERSTYFEGLSEFPIEIVERAAQEIRVTGSTSWSFVTLPEWYRVAAEVFLGGLEATAEALIAPPPAAEVEVDLERATRAKDALVDQCEARGEHGIARFFRAQVVRHPSARPMSQGGPLWCQTCSDTGLAFDEDVQKAAPCACVRENPILALRRLQGRLRRRLGWLAGKWACGATGRAGAWWGWG